MRAQGNKYNLEKHYLGKEKDKLINDDSNSAYLFAEKRHTMGAVRTARRRFIKDQKFDFNTTPPILYDICLRLGIISNTNTDVITKDKSKKKLVSDDIFSFLCSLPGASHMDENMWLETPELWCFVNNETIYSSYSRSGIEFKKVIERNTNKWCDKWVKYNAVPEEIQSNIFGTYIIPYSGLKKIKEYHGIKRKDAYNATFFPGSLISKDKYIFNGSKNKETRIKNKINHFPLGYISFEYNVPISYLCELRDCGNVCR